MDYQNDFKKWKQSIINYSKDEVNLPHQPIDEIVAYAETLAIEATKDKDALATAGLDERVIDELPSLAGATRYCQALWMSEYRTKEEAQKEWLEKSPDAYDLRDEMLHHFKFAFRNYPNVQTKVSRISDGNSHKDMIQDLIELAVLGEKNPEPLIAIKFDASINKKARNMSHQMSELLALSNGSKDEKSENKLLRDKAYSILMERINTIRDYGKYVFWRDENRKEKYMANYRA